jgi:MarR family transcriptional regulator, 2-MHQ and catechol-resistance regulon repressor
VSGTTLREELKKRSQFDSPHQEAMLNVLRTADLLAAAFERLFRRYRLTNSQYNVLRILRGEGQPLSCGEIASRLINRMPDITRLVDRLEQTKLARRVRTRQDRRLVLIEITPAGLDLLARLDGPVANLHQEQLGHLTHRQLHELSRLLEAARTNPSGDQSCPPQGDSA